MSYNIQSIKILNLFFPDIPMRFLLYVIYLPKLRKILSQPFSKIIALLWTTKAELHFIVRYFFKERNFMRKTLYRTKEYKWQVVIKQSLQNSFVRNEKFFSFLKVYKTLQDSYYILQHLCEAFFKKWSLWNLFVRITYNDRVLRNLSVRLAKLE